MAPILHLARIVIEFETPFLIGAGRGATRADIEPVLDVNGLPALPGASMTGALRETYRLLESHGDATELPPHPQVFGFQDQGGEASASCGSALSVSWGCIHDSHDRPVEGRQPMDSADPVLRFARDGVLRDHVRLSHRGAALKHGKFEELIVAAGHRFSFELALEDAGGELSGAFDASLSLLAHGQLAFGRGRGRGQGRFRVVRLHRRRFDLGTKQGYLDWCALEPGLDSVAGFESCLAMLPDDRQGQASARTELRLEATGLWFIGSGQPSAEVDMHPYTESRVVWKDRGEVEDDCLVIPGSSLRGALRHRTAFHYNALAGRFADQQDEARLEELAGDDNPAVHLLFGAKGDNDETEDGQPKKPGSRGLVSVPDVVVGAQRRTRLNHVSLDRFAGGAVEGRLFCEEGLWQGSVTVAVELGKPPDGAPIPDEVKTAFHRALRDLREGRLTLGAGSGRGNGVFRAAEGTDSTWSGPLWP